MKSLPTEGYTALYISTATIKGWKNLLKPDKYKEVITNAMSFLTEEESVWIYAFVIMPNHIHWVWQIYIHQNPVQKKWHLAAKPEDYTYSSASLYVLGERRWPFVRHFWYDMD